MFAKKMKSAILALALSVPLVGAAQAPPGPPQAPDGPQGPPAWRGRGPGFGQGMGMQRGMRRGMHHGRGMGHSRGMKRGGLMRGRGLGRMLQDPGMRERLGVTSEQAAKIQSQESAFARSRVRSRADLRVKRMELDELLAAEKADRAAIDKKMRELNEARFADEKAAMDHRLTMRDALTPEQRQKLEAWHKEMRQQHMQRGFGPERGPGFRRGPRGPLPPDAAPPRPPVENPER